MKKLPAPSRRLDWILFGLRWLLTLSALAALVTLRPASAATTLPQSFIVAALIAAVYDVLIGVLILVDLDDSILRPLALLGDIAVALMFFWVSNESPLVLMGVALFPIITASLRYGRVVGLAATALTGIVSLLLIAIVPHETSPQVIPLLTGLLFLFLTSLLTSFINAMKGNDARPRPVTLDEREIEASRLRSARERARAIYEMASTLSATLDYAKVLDAALDVGVLGLREMDQNTRLMGAVLLFQGQELRVLTSRRFNRQDNKVIVPGRRGVLGLALNQAEPVFAADAKRDPELQYFSALQDAKSILAIPLRAGFDNFGVLLFGSQSANAFSDDHVELLTAIGTQATIALQNAVLYQNLLQEKERIVDVEEDARKKLARDLHDGPTQSVRGHCNARQLYSHAA